MLVYIQHNAKKLKEQFQRNVLREKHNCVLLLTNTTTKRSLIRFQLQFHLEPTKKCFNITRKTALALNIFFRKRKKEIYSLTYTHFLAKTYSRAYNNNFIRKYTVHKQYMP